MTERVCVATGSTVFAAGEYTKVPGSEAEASGCVALIGVPYVIAAGWVQVMVGIAIPAMVDGVADLEG